MSEIKTVKDAAATIKLLNQKILLLEKQIELQDVMIKKMVEQAERQEKKTTDYYEDYTIRTEEYMTKRLNHLHNQVTGLDEKYLGLKEDLERTRELLNTFIIKLPEVIQKAEKEMVEKYMPKKKKRPLRRYNPFS